MVQHKAALALAVLSVFIVMESTSALPFYRKAFVPPRVPLTIHAPVSGADLALAAGRGIFQTLFTPNVIYTTDADNVYSINDGVHFNGLGGGIISYDRPDFPEINYIHSMGGPTYGFF